MKRITPYFLGLLSLVFLTSPTLSMAHKVNIFAWVEGNSVFTESYFSDGTKVINAIVEVFDTEGKKLLTGTTDKEGKFDFGIPLKTDLKITLNASMGHRAEYLLPKEEITGDQGSLDKNIKESQGEKEVEEKISVSREEIKSIVEDALDKKLNPILRKITLIQDQGPRISEIIGGIGYIIGLMGIALYFSNRKKVKQ